MNQAFHEIAVSSLDISLTFSAFMEARGQIWDLLALEWGKTPIQVFQMAHYLSI